MVKKKHPVMCPWRPFLALALILLSPVLTHAQTSTRTANAIESAGSWPARCRPADRNMAFLTTGTVGPGYCSANDTWVSLVPSGGGVPVGGSGTAGYLPYFSGSSTLGNSLLRQAGGNLFMPTSGSVAIGLDIDTPPTGILELVSSTKGFVPPKVTTATRDLMTPQAGWQIHNTTTTRPSWYNGTAWAEPVDNVSTQTVAGSKTFSSAPTFSSLIANSFLYSGTGGIAATTAAPTDGQFLIGVTGGAPVVASLTAGANITLTPGAGSLAIASSGGGTAFGIRPVDPYPATTSRAFANIHESAGSGVKHFSGWGVCPGTGADCATTTADTTWELVFWDIPPVLPTSGTATLRCWAIANDASGAAKVNWKWNTCAAEVDCSGVTLNAEGTSTVTWATGDADQLKLLDITMDASTLTAGQPVVGKLVFESTGWTEPAVSTWNCSIVWVP
jgi:hypothetical protein